MDQQPLLKEIEAFCSTHQMSEAKFGVLALKDWKFVRDLRGEGRSRPRRIWPETAEAVRNFIATYKPEPQAELARAS